MKKTKLYIDCQFAQTEVWDRGMGRYTFSLLQTLYSTAEDVDFYLIFSKHLPQNRKAIEAITAQCANATVVELDLLPSKQQGGYLKVARRNKEVLEAYIASLKHYKGTREVFMIPCLFQEPTACVFPDGVETCLVYYDAIPLLYFGRYLNVIDYDNYLDRHQMLFAADRIFTISQTVADDIALYYGMKYDGEHVINIDGACIVGMFDEFKKPKKKLPEKYILFSTSNDIRKNNLAAARAFDQLRSLSNTDYKLVITSSFDEPTRKSLERHADNLIFTGTVSNAELAWLYKHAEAVLFTSEYEGLGLPILEAVKMGKKVVCSNIPVFREISSEAFYFFDTLDISDMTLKLYQALEGKDWAAKQKLYPAINKHYTWERTARLVYDAIQKEPQISPSYPVVRPKVAILAPSPDGYSAIGKVIQELHATTSKYFDVHYYFENRKEKPPVNIRPNYVEHLAPCYDIQDFTTRAYKDYDAVIYHVGNSEYHFQTILDGLHMPGIAILHDTKLTEAFGEMVRLGIMPLQRMEAEGLLDQMTGAKQTAYITSLANNQIAGVVHSAFAHDAVKAVMRQDVELIHAELPVAQPQQSVQLQERETVHVGLAGILSGRKGLDTIKALAVDKRLAGQIVLHVFGFSLVEPEAIAEIKTYKNVRLATNLSDLEYQMQLADLDILVNFRLNYRGETSLAVLEAMRYGCVAIVNAGLGWFAELPDESVVKVESQDEIIETVHVLVNDRDRRRNIGAAAKEFTAKMHDPETYIQMLHKLVAEPKDTPNAQRGRMIKTARNLDEIIRRYNHLEG